MNNIIKFYLNYSLLGLILLLVPFTPQAQDSATNISGTWWRSGMGSPGANLVEIEAKVLTKLGAELMDKFDPVDDPAVSCDHPGAARVILSPYPIKIEQNTSNVIIQYEEWATTRNIPLDATQASQDSHKKAMGNSLAHYQDNILIIETSQLSKGLARVRGQFLWLSDQAVIFEEYSTNQDQRLVLKMTINDPIMLEKPYVIQKQWGSYEGDLLGFECIDRERPQA
jgi:hypothetical protein